jgi:Domain of unknown function (DUF4395)
MINDISCPTSPDRVDENVARTAAFLTILVALINTFLGTYWLILALAFDFALRAFTFGSYSPIRVLAKEIVKRFRLEKKLTDAAPKKFAAGLGMSFCLMIGLFQIFGWQFLSNITSTILIFCAVLESVFSTCLGCIVYSYLIVPFKN